MRKLFLLTAILFIYSTAAFSQNAKPQPSMRNNAVSFELGKSGLIASVSYDHRFGDKEMGVRLAVGGSMARSAGALLIAPGIYKLFGNAGKYFELGIDAGYLKIDSDRDLEKDQRGFWDLPMIYPDYNLSSFYGTVNLGYRSYGRTSLFRIGVSPGFADNRFIPGGYISIGVTF